MAWFKNKQIKQLEDNIAALEEKLNTSQALIHDSQGHYIYSTETAKQLSYKVHYEGLEIVNRGVNMIVDDVAEIPATVGEKLTNVTKVTDKPVKKVTVERLLNIEPNPFQDINTFKRNILIDYIVDGNIFIYFDGVHLYHLPANKVVIHSDPDTFVEKYTFMEKVNYKPSEIIHVKENSFGSIYRGISRLRPADRTMRLLVSLRNFQDNFFKNGAVPGLVLKTPNTVSDRIKARLLASWQEKYRPDTGGRTPMILDGGFEVDSITSINFKELDFTNSVAENEKIILKALGIPPILFDGGNNANISPNLRLYYLETVLPIVRKINFAYERFFGFEIWEDTVNTPALQPELKEQANYLSSLVNAGIITTNEARAELGKEKISGEDKLRVPANIAGSAGNPSEGGRPEDDKEDDKE